MQSKHKAISSKSSYLPVKLGGTIKILVVGDKGAGKSSIVQQTTENQETDPFCCLYKSTVCHSACVCVCVCACACDQDSR